MTASTIAPANRPKRVRTGCLTCRSRHLKCDEGTPDCLNCRKSNRECKRGVRLNFIDITTEQPPVILMAPDWKVEFQDESREIASEYVGGARRYKLYRVTASPPTMRNSPGPKYLPPPPPPLSSTSAPPQFASRQPPPSPPPPPPPPPSNTVPSQYNSRQQLPPIQPLLPSDSGFEEPPKPSLPPPPLPPRHTYDNQPLILPLSSASQAQYGNHQVMASSPHKDTKRYLDDPEETLFMQVFVEEVGIWMDSLDSLKHFSRLLPFTSLDEPMLLNAFLACGARHLSLVNNAYPESRANEYYSTATGLLLSLLQNQHRDISSMEACATTAIVLNAYEIMSEKPLQRMNHIAGARALLKECGWNARTEGVGAACFWLNVSMELLTCLRFGWEIGWHPDEWGLDMDMSRPCPPGREELWAYRIVYILGKISGYKKRFITYQSQEGPPDATGAQKLYEEWCRLRDLAASWDARIPYNMQPLAILPPYRTSAKSCFPEVWIIKRCAIVAQLFYHTALVVMSQINPYEPSQADEMQRMKIHHSHQICGITGNLKDRGTASVALRSLATAGETLTDRREQEEVLQIFRRITNETGWRVNAVYSELRKAWNWVSTDTPVTTASPSSVVPVLNTGDVIPRTTTSQSNGYGHYPSPQEHQRHQSQVHLLQQHQPQQPPQHPQHQQSSGRQLPKPGSVNPFSTITDVNSLSSSHPYHPQYQRSTLPQLHTQQRQSYDQRHHYS